LERVQKTAEILSQAKGFVSNDLLGKTQTCFAVCVTAFETGLNPFFLAQGAFQTPEGKVGFDTRRIQAVVEAKNLFRKEPDVEYTGPWDNLIGKFKKEKSENKGPNGREKWKTTRTWTAADAKGCKCKITYHFRDRNEPTSFEMDLAEVGTFFSTSWATEPKNQFYNLVFRRGLNQKRASALAGTPAYEDLLAQEEPMKEVNPRPEKSGDAGLDAFAGEPEPTETVVEADGSNAPEGETTATVEPESAAAAEDLPSENTPTDNVVIWASEDEPERKLKSISNAVFVLRNLIKDAKTPALAQAVFDHNLRLITQAGKEAGDSLEAELVRSQQKANLTQCGPDQAQAEPGNVDTVWLGPDDPKHAFNGEGNAIHLMRTAIREAKTAAAAKTIRDQNADLIGRMPDRIGEELDFEVSKRFEGKDQEGGQLL
ncbi:MAG: recombinase RecT, partial [Geminicoccaceae bacterium]